MATATSFNTTSLTSLKKTSQFHQKLSSLSSSTCQFRIISKPLSIVIKKASLNPRSELVSNGDDNNGGNSKRSSSIAALEQIKISPSNRYTKEKSSIIVLGLSYHTSPVEMREKLAIQDEELPRAIAELCGLNHIEEAGVLSTCNRMEIYVVALSWHRGVREVVDWMAKKSGIPASDLRRHLVLLRDGDATQHLFEVAAGLDSLVLGEGQILSQVRNVLKSGEQIPGFGRIIGGMFKHASKVGGRVRDEAKLAFGAVSMSSAAVELAIKKLPTGSSHIARVLLIGAGEMGEDVIKHLAGKKWTQVVVVNRSEERVSAIREKVKNIEIIYKPFTEIFACIAEADVVFTCTSADTFLFKENVDSLPLVSPAVGGSRLFIDISVPRNVSSCVSEVTYTQVYNGDDLKQVVDANKDKRRQKAMEAQPIIVEETKKFRDWRDSLETVPFIKRLRSHGEAIVKEELRKCFAKSGKNISEEAKKIIESMAFSIMNKMLHGPMVHLRCDEKDGRDLHETLENMYVLDRIYNLETEASVLEQKIRDKLNQMQGET